MKDILFESMAVLGNTFSNEQRSLLLKIYDEMAEAGVSNEQLGPLSCLIFLDWSLTLSGADIERAKELALEYKW